MRAITLRNIPRGVERVILRRAKQTGLSLNKALISLLEEATHLRPRQPKRSKVHHDLDFLFGSWTPAQADAFDRVLAEQRRIDPGHWK